MVPMCASCRRACIGPWYCHLYSVKRIVLLHGTNVCILSMSLYWPMVLTPEFCRHACIGPQCRCVHPAEELVLAHGAAAHILSKHSYWPMVPMCASCR